LQHTLENYVQSLIDNLFDILKFIGNSKFWK
jgi:hypothetical protein